MTRLHNSQKKQFYFASLLPYIVLLYASLFAALRIRYPRGLAADALQSHVLAFSIVFALWLFVYYANRLFDKRLITQSDMLIGHLTAAGVNTVIAVIYFYFQPGLILTPRRFLLLVVGIATVLLLCWDIATLRLLRRTRYAMYLLAGSGLYPDLEESLNSARNIGVDYKGLLRSADEAGAMLGSGSIVVIPDMTQYVSSSMQELFKLRTQGVVILNAFQAYEQLFRRIPLESLGEWWFLENVEYRSGVYDLLKRMLDVIAGAVLGLVTLLVIIPAAIAIKLDSRGPVFFAQPRIGKNGRVFTLYKLRTMSALGDTGTWTAQNDSRITRVGKFLRRFRLDELPQSMHIVLGEMSIVGPRPEQVHIVKELAAAIPFYNERHIAKPGLTGWSQLHVYAASVSESKRKLEYDLYYIKHRSMRFDLEILLKTVYVFIKGGHR